MRLFSPKTIVVVLCLLLCSVAAGAEETLTNRSIERMVAAGLSPELITSKINSTSNSFDVSIDTILQLKKNGFHDDIIKAMVEAAGSQNSATRNNDNYNNNDQYYDPGQSYEPNSAYADSYRPQRKTDATSKLLKDIAETAILKEKRDYTWKTKAHAIAVTLKTIYPANTHNIKYWWAYTQYSVLVEKEHHILKGIKKVLYFDGNHQDALILKGDTCFAQAKRLGPGDDSAAYSQEEMADDAKKAYLKALDLPTISAVKKAKIYYQLGEMAEEIDQNKKRAKKLWQQAMDEDPRSHWGLLAAGKLGVVPPQSSQEQYQPPADS